MRCLTTLTFLMLASLASAQIGREELSTDSGSVVLHYFESGEVSTRESWDPDHRWGRSIAYDRQGGEIFNYNTRRMGGHASVTYRYHANGGVSRAEVSDMPDGGIQWYKSTTTFDEEGNQIGFDEFGRDDRGFIPRVALQEIAICQRMFMNEVFLVNRTRHAGKAKVKAIHPSPALKDALHTVAPGDTIRLGMYSMGETFAPPNEHVEVEVEKTSLKRMKRKSQATYASAAVQETAEHMRHYLVITGWKKRK